MSGKKRGLPSFLGGDILVGMKSISQSLQIQKPKFRNERDEVLSQIIDGVNKNRAADGFEELKPSFIAYKTSHLKVPDLYYLLSICKQSDNFSRTFFGCLKVK